MAQLKDLIVNGASRFIGDAFANKIQITTISAPTTAGGSTYGVGSNGQVLMSNGTSTYWGSLGGAAGKTVLDRTTATAIASTGTALVTERTVYYGLPTINNSHAYTSSTTIYAPTGGGTAGQYLKAVGATNTPIWETFSASTVGLGNVSNNATLNNVTGAKGDILYWSAANTPAHLTNTSSTTKQFLSITSQVPSWSSVTKSDVGLGNVENTKLSTWTGSSNITTVGTLSSGTVPWARLSDVPSYVLKTGDTMTGRLTAAKGFVNYIGTGTVTNGAVSGSTYTPLKWTFNAGVTSLVDGDTFTLKVPGTTNGDYGVFLSVDNGVTYYPIALNGTARLTTHYPTGTYIQVVYESTGSVASVFPLAGGTARVTVSNGAFRIINFYNSDAGDYSLRTANGRFYAGATGLNPYSIACLDNANKFSMLLANNTNAGTGTSKTINTSGKYKLPATILYYHANNSTAANNLVPSTYVTYFAYYAVDTRYSHNHTTTFTTNSPLYIECTIDTNGYWSPTATCITQTLTAGNYYIYLGQTYSTEYQLSLAPSHPCYYYDGLNLIDATPKLIEKYGYTKNAGTVTSVQVNASSPLQSSSSTASTSTLSTTISFTDQSPNLVLAGPTVPDDSDAAPTFRALVAADIPSISKNKISDFPTTMTPSSHTHGNITNDGKISSDTTKASGQKFIFADSNGALIRSNVALGTGTGTYLRNDGTWGTPAGTYTLPTAASDTKGGIKVGTGLTMNGEVLNHSNSITAGTATGTAASTLTFGGTFKYPTVTYDAQGHITSTSSVTLTLPTLPEASTSAKGIVQLFNEDFTVGGTTGSTVTTQAVTPQALYHVWELANSKTSNTGTVTSVSAGNGLAGGPITTSGSLSVNFGTSATAVSDTASAGTAVTVSRSDHTHNIVVGTGDNQGQVKIAGQNASVNGLGTMAYESKDTYLPKSGGTITGNITIDDNVNPCPTILNVPDPQNDGDAANKHYVDQIIAASDAMVFKGILQGSSTETPSSTDSYTTNGQTIYFGHTPSGDAGDTYKVSVGGFLLGLPVEVGDTIICLTDNTPASTSSNLTTVRDNWAIIQSNIDSSIYKGTNPFVQNHVVIVSSTNGEVKSASTNTTTIGSVTGAIELTAGTKPSLTMSVDANEVLSFSWSNGTFPALKNQLTQASVSVVTGFTADT